MPSGQSSTVQSTPGSPLLQIRGLQKSFGGKAVLRGVDLDVHKGEFLTLIGESGCGKSVLLKHLIGLLCCDAGSILFEGREVSSFSERQWMSVRRRVGILFQEGALFDSLSVAQNVAYGLREHGLLPADRISSRVSESLALVDLSGIEAMMPSELSGGMRKRVSLARAIALEPALILYDEPTEGLDPINVTRINRLLLRLCADRGVTTLVVTHNMRSAFSVGDRIAFMADGKIRVQGTAKQLLGLSDRRLRPFQEASKLRSRMRST